MATKPIGPNAPNSAFVVPGFWSHLAPVRLAHSMRLGFRQILRKPVRNFLVLQGVIWGTALAIFAPSSIGGSRQNAFENPGKYHLDRIVAAKDPGAPDPRPFSRADVDAVVSALGKELRAAAGLSVVSATLAGPGGPLPVELLLTEPALATARDFRVQAGRYLEASDVRERRQVCVLEPALARELLGTRNPLGATLTLARPESEAPIDLEVVGLMEQRGAERLGMDALGMNTQKAPDLRTAMLQAVGVLHLPGPWERNDRAIHVPTGVLSPETTFEWLYVRVKDFKTIETQAGRIAEALTLRERPPQLLYDASVPFLVGDQLDLYIKLNRAISICCVVMGLAVVVIIMLVGVLSRFREIGIRRVEGATSGDIAVQFAVESGTLCFVGGLLGVPASYLLAHIWLSFELSQMARYSPELGLTVSIVLSIATAGVLAGFIPAWRAARLDPVETLKYE